MVSLERDATEDKILVLQTLAKLEELADGKALTFNAYVHLFAKASFASWNVVMCAMVILVSTADLAGRVRMVQVSSACVGPGTEGISAKRPQILAGLILAFTVVYASV